MQSAIRPTKLYADASEVTTLYGDIEMCVYYYYKI